MKTLCCLLSLFLCTCASEIKYYQGYIYALQGNPLPNLKIYARENITNTLGMTDRRGWVCVPKDSVNMFLMIEKNGVIIDSIQVLREGAEKFSFFFTDQSSDTVFIDMSKKVEQKSK